MKKLLVTLTLAFSALNAQDEFVRGIMMFGEDHAEFNSQLKDSLHLNWVQATVDDGYGNKDLHVLENDGELNIAGISHQYPDIYESSRAQRMEFEAERGPSSLWNYFEDKPSGDVDQFDPTLLISSGSAGYMVRDAVPDDEYRHERTHYTSSFIMKRTPALSGNPQVATLEAWCKAHNEKIADRVLYNNDFTTSGLETKTLEFDLSQPAYPAFAPGILFGGNAPTIQADSCLTDSGYHVDIRVYWHGNVTTWLDKVIVEDDSAQVLFSGSKDNAIVNSASDFTSYPLMKRFYLLDEPTPGTYLAHNYVQALTRQAYGSDTTGGKGSGITASNRRWDRFLLDAQPREFLVDAYPITTNVPTLGMTDPEATGAKEGVRQ